MPEPSAHPQYDAVVGRADEMARLQAQAQAGKPMLVFGPEGAGKTRLLHEFLKGQSLSLYVDKISSPRDLLLSLMESLRACARRGASLPAASHSLSTPSLKGVVQRALDESPFILVLDHVAGPSRPCTALIKELNHYGRTPVVLAARTPHMEDIGTLRPMCADRSERVELKNFAPPIALEFARRQASQMELRASNLESALHSVAEWSQGNPGSILRMIKMAQLPKYRMGDQIKAHVLYLDHLMGHR